MPSAVQVQEGDFNLHCQKCEAEGPSPWRVILGPHISFFCDTCFSLHLLDLVNPHDPNEAVPYA